MASYPPRDFQESYATGPNGSSPPPRAFHTQAWGQVEQTLTGDFKTSMQQYQTELDNAANYPRDIPGVISGHQEGAAPTTGEQRQYYYAGPEHLASMYAGHVPTPGFFDHLQYLPMNAQFYMPPGAGLPYMDPYGLMNPAALPPINASMLPKKATPKKEKPRCC